MRTDKINVIKIRSFKQNKTSKNVSVVRIDNFFVNVKKLFNICSQY